MPIFELETSTDRTIEAGLVSAKIAEWWIRDLERDQRRGTSLLPYVVFCLLAPNRRHHAGLLHIYFVD